MFVKQISVFLENTEGRLEELLKILAQGGVNLLSASLADTMEYGVLRLLSNEPEKAKQILKDAGFAARIDEVIAVVVPDAVGSLAKVIGMIHAADINISYIYGLSIDGEGAPIAIKTNDNAKAEKLLNAAGVKTLGMEDLV
ncbi:MAG: amino acid-binding protein [Lachnospiraceae bacterium]|nr:amino acid-binding protein [Lachnospiraceae bacterium]MBR5659014.1 amino acid-binding protein [Lachnospiraceae bacterium]